MFLLWPTVHYRFFQHLHFIINLGCHSNFQRTSIWNITSRVSTNFNDEILSLLLKLPSTFFRYLSMVLFRFCVIRSTAGYGDISYKTLNTPVMFQKTSSSFIWNNSLDTFTPKGSLAHLYLPKGVIMVVILLDSSFSFVECHRKQVSDNVLSSWLC